MSHFIILNANMKRWGHETYPSREAAERELRDFFKGVKVDFKKFTIQEGVSGALSKRVSGAGAFI